MRTPEADADVEQQGRIRTRANVTTNATTNANANAEGKSDAESSYERPLRFVSRHRAGGSLPQAASHDDDDPLAGIANLFDVSVAFIVALLIALFSLFSAGSMLDPASNVTLVKQADNGSLEIITKKGSEISVQKVTDRSLSGQGTRLGTAYQLANGQVVYVPEGEGPPK